MAEYELTKKAVGDLNGIWLYSAEVWSERQADAYYFNLLQCCQMLAEQPHLGMERKEIRPGIWSFRAEKHVLLYTKLEDHRIQVVRILHTRMDIQKRMTKD